MSQLIIKYQYIPLLVVDAFDFRAEVFLSVGDLLEILPIMRICLKGDLECGEILCVGTGELDVSRFFNIKPGFLADLHVMSNADSSFLTSSSTYFGFFYSSSTYFITLTYYELIEF